LLDRQADRFAGRWIEVSVAIGAAGALGGAGPERTFVWRAVGPAISGLVGTSAAGCSVFSGRVRKSAPGFCVG
jgi:hypothetical protein